MPARARCGSMQIEQPGPLREHQRLVPLGDARSSSASSRRSTLDEARGCPCASLAGAPDLEPARRGRPPGAGASSASSACRTPPPAVELRHDLARGWRRGRRRRRRARPSSSSQCSTASVRGGSSGATSRLRRRSTNGRMRGAQPLGGTGLAGRDRHARSARRSRCGRRAGRGWRSASGSTAPRGGFRPACRSARRESAAFSR